MAETRFTHPTKASAPAYTFSKKGRMINNSDQPGPGAYNGDSGYRLRES